MFCHRKYSWLGAAEVICVFPTGWSHELRVRSQGQQPKQRDPDFPLSSHLGQLIWLNPKAFPGQPRNIVPPACSGSSSGPLPRWDVPRTPHQGGVQEAS
ncbi:hypothetical protein ILYODFUR_016165 [Ilyodon furcidens]|uniref:Uncharacterized protein n=1 Tax=Ilyodon furcidens TaxID=33524 RepID=A0ABV0SLN5_9TELE